ncbi:MAG TPA: hypothetical protein VNL77_05340 [Roseiflexaceae bacterium]|nr:hypothetical protein [Roseiflexaceae bacterium]
MTVPTAVYVIWIVVLAVVVLVILPLTVALLQRTLNAARNIERYLAEMRDAGAGIAGNTQHIAALDDTIAVAGQLLETAGSIDAHAAMIETTLAARAVGDGRGS